MLTYSNIDDVLNILLLPLSVYKYWLILNDETISIHYYEEKK